MKDRILELHCFRSKLLRENDNVDNFSMFLQTFKFCGHSNYLKTRIHIGFFMKLKK